MQLAAHTLPSTLPRTPTQHVSTACIRAPALPQTLPKTLYQHVSTTPAAHLLGQVLQRAAAEGRAQRGARHLRAQVVVVLRCPAADQLVRRRLRLPARMERGPR